MRDMNDQIITHQECSFCDECFIIPTIQREFVLQSASKLEEKKETDWVKMGWMWMG